MAKMIILGNAALGDGFYKMTLLPPEKKSFIPGQFINISVGDKYGMILKRPISVYDYKDGFITVIYEVRGKGTAALAEMPEGTETDVLYFLGNGFQLNESEKRIMLIGGGIGAAPLYSVINGYKGKDFYSYLGFQNAGRIILKDEFCNICQTVIATDDGSEGKKGYVAPCALNDIEKIKPDVILACGPKPMLNALALTAPKDIRVLVSLEERMGCGFGACLVCAVNTANGMKRVCKDGPVFDIKELVL